MMGLGNSVTPFQHGHFWYGDMLDFWGVVSLCLLHVLQLSSPQKRRRGVRQLFPGAGKTRVWVTQVKIGELKKMEVQELENCYLLEDRSEGTS